MLPKDVQDPERGEENRFSSLLCPTLSPRYEKAKEDFNTAMKNLRGNLLIDYKQLGLTYKLYSCEVCSHYINQLILLVYGMLGCVVICVAALCLNTGDG